MSTLSRGLERLSTDCESHFSRSPRPHHRTDVDHLQWCLIAPFERLDEGKGQSRSVSSLQFQSVCPRTSGYLLMILLSLLPTLSMPLPGIHYRCPCLAFLGQSQCEPVSPVHSGSLPKPSPPCRAVLPPPPHPALPLPPSRCSTLSPSPWSSAPSPPSSPRVSIAFIQGGTSERGHAEPWKGVGPWRGSLGVSGVQCEWASRR